jgi:hypothetical protein
MRLLKMLQDPKWLDVPLNHVQVEATVECNSTGVMSRAHPMVRFRSHGVRVVSAVGSGGEMQCQNKHKNRHDI